MLFGSDVLFEELKESIASATKKVVTDVMSENRIKMLAIYVYLQTDEAKESLAKCDSLSDIENFIRGLDSSIK